MEINVNVQTNTENHQSINDNHNYDNRLSYNNLPLQPGECLVPIRVDWEMVKHFNMCQDNLETWHIGPNKVLVAFAPVKIKDKPTALKQFNADVREQSFLCRISGTMQVPVMPGIPALYCNILTISNYDIEIISINLIKALLFKHSQTPY